MNGFDVPGTLSAWQLFSRLGEVQLLLPALLLALVALLRHAPGRALAGWWLAALALATALTTASKLAFIGWGIGSPALDFTGISGHAMFAAAVYPLLLGTLAPLRWRWPAVAAGALLALLLGWSRVVVGAHSASEVWAGLLLGGAVSALGLVHAGAWRAALSAWLPLAAGLWLLVAPGFAPPAQTHALVTQLALQLSGQSQPYVRGQWRGHWHDAKALPAAALRNTALPAISVPAGTVAPR